MYTGEHFIKWEKYVLLIGRSRDTERYRKGLLNSVINDKVRGYEY